MSHIDDGSFDCSAFLRPGLQQNAHFSMMYDGVSSDGEYSPSPPPNQRHPVPIKAFSAQAIPPGNNYRDHQDVRRDQNYQFNMEKLKALDELNTDQFYPDECHQLLNFVDDFYDNQFMVQDRNELEDMRQQLIALSSNFDRDTLDNLHERPNPYLQEDFLNKVSSPSKYQEEPAMLDFVEETLKGFGEKRPDHWEPPQEDQNRKRRLCRHFLKGHCKRGRACDFLHDSSIFCPDLQKVFLGGLPAHITENTLRSKLAEQGYTVINKPKVLRGFTPQVCLGSIEEAQRLIEKGKINIDGSLVDVRPYEAFAKDNLDKKLPDDIKRSVFLGGLANGTTGQMIKDDLEKMDVKVVNHPIIKTGFTPMVTLGTTEQAQMLIKLKKVLVNETLVDVRPYVNFRKRY